MRRARSGEPDIAIEISFDLPGGAAPVFLEVRDAEIRTYLGRLVEGKDPRDTQEVAERLLSANADVWALQEVEDLPTLQRFVAEHGLTERYPHRALIEGNDDRLIDGALVSSLPLGAVTNWQHPRHPAGRGLVAVFDALLVEIPHFVMERRMLLGIKRRAERAGREEAG